MHHLHSHVQHWKKVNHAERLFLHDKFLLNENKSCDKANNYSTWQVFKDLILVFLILLSVAHGLRFAESSISTIVNSSFLEHGTHAVWDNVKQEVKSRVIFDKIFLVNQALAISHNYIGEFDSQSHTIINIEPGKSFTYVIKFKNTSSEVWKNSGVQAVGVKTFTSPSRVYHSSWVNSNTPVLMTEGSVLPGQIATFSFVLYAPQGLGLTEERFVLATGDSDMITGTKFNIPFNVTNNTNAKIPNNVVTTEIPKSDTPGSSSSASSSSTYDNQTSPINSITPNNTSEQVEEDDIPDQTQGDAPNININPVQENTPAYVESIRVAEPQSVRVGLYYTTKPIRLTADKPYYIKDGYGQIVEQVAANKITTVVFSPSNQQYYLSVNNRSRISLSYLRFESDSPEPIFIITSLNNSPSWNPSLNFNQFRNSLEIRYAPSTDRLWAINELSMEDYIAGIAETSNVSHIEFHKTMAIAARSYALYHYNRGTKHASENFTVDATYDQVYKGYTSESVMPRYAQAVRETAGQIVTYNSDPVITPYFSQSDGRTRSFNEVWYGSYPWLVSVPVPQDAGKPLLGHGVGLSAWGALRMATYESKTYDQILRYFYTGTQVEKVY